MRLLAIDSNVFIAFLAQEKPFFKEAADIFVKFEARKINVVFSALVFGEVLRISKGSSLPELKLFFDLFDGCDLAADKAICIQAAELRSANPTLKLPDAIHLATAIASHANIFVTADKKLATITSKYLPVKMLGSK